MPKLYVSESAIVRDCIMHLTMFDFTVWRNNAGTALRESAKGKQYRIRLSPEGTPDIIGFAPSGRFVAIECKVPGGHVRPRQKDFIERAVECGCYACIAYSSADIDWMVGREQAIKQGKETA